MTLSSPGTSKVARRIDTHLVFVQRSRKRTHRDKRKLESCDVRLLKCQKCTLGKTTLTNIKKHPKKHHKTPETTTSKSEKWVFFIFLTLEFFFRFWSILDYFWSTRVSNRSARSADKQRRKRKRKDNLFFPDYVPTGHRTVQAISHLILSRRDG